MSSLHWDALRCHKKEQAVRFRCILDADIIYENKFCCITHTSKLVPELFHSFQCFSHLLSLSRVSWIDLSSKETVIWNISTEAEEVSVSLVC